MQKQNLKGKWIRGDREKGKVWQWTDTLAKRWDTGVILGGKKEGTGGRIREIRKRAAGNGREGLIGG